VTEPRRRPGVADPVQKINPHLIAVGILILLLLGGLVFIFTGGGGDRGDDKLTNDQAGVTVSGDDPEAKCGVSANNELIKQELFRRAAAPRATDKESYSRLAGFAVLRAETPILRGYDQRIDSVSCSAFVTIDLPPGVSAGGRRSLTGEVGYTLRGGKLTVTDGDSLVSGLALLARDGLPPEAGLEAGDPLAPEPEGAVEVGDGEAGTANAEAGPATVYPGRPSFNCGDAGTRGEVAVCSNPGLSALDVNMAAQYRRAVSNASPQQRAALAQTRDRFLAYRDNCPTVGCIREAYVGRMREIRDIMEAR
jgi:uncharacterized protein YecT (DUF1311 family)